MLCHRYPNTYLSDPHRLPLSSTTLHQHNGKLTLRTLAMTRLLPIQHTNSANATMKSTISGCRSYCYTVNDHMWCGSNTQVFRNTTSLSPMKRKMTNAIVSQAQTPEQRLRNAKFTKAQDARRGKPESEVKVKRDVKSPVSPVVVGTLCSVSLMPVKSRRRMGVQTGIGGVFKMCKGSWTDRLLV